MLKANRAQLKSIRSDMPEPHVAASRTRRWYHRSRLSRYTPAALSPDTEPGSGSHMQILDYKSGLVLDQTAALSEPIFHWQRRLLRSIEVFVSLS